MKLFGYQEQFHPEYDLHIFLINTISLRDIIAEILFVCRFRIFNLKIMTVSPHNYHSGDKWLHNLCILIGNHNIKTTYQTFYIILRSKKYFM